MDKISFPGLLNPDKVSFSLKKFLIQFAQEYPEQVQDQLARLNRIYFPPAAAAPAALHALPRQEEVLPAVAPANPPMDFLPSPAPINVRTKKYDFRDLPDDVFAEASSRETYNKGILKEIDFKGLLDADTVSDSDKRILVKWVRDDPDRVQEKINDLNSKKPKVTMKFGGKKKKKATNRSKKRRNKRALSRRSLRKK